MARRIAVVAEKGGVGKTTVTVHLAAILGGDYGRRVLIIDLDKQSHSTLSLGLEQDELGLYALLTTKRDEDEPADWKPLMTRSEFGVDVVRSGRGMANFNSAAATVKEPVYILKDAMESLADDEWDYIFLDCPPELGMCSLNALTAADMYLVPVKPGYLNITGVTEVIKTATGMKKRINPALVPAGVVLLDFDERTSLAGQTRDNLKGKVGDLLFETVIHRNTKIEQAPGFRKPVTSYAPSSTGAKEFRALAEEFERKLGIEEGRRVANA